MSETTKRGHVLHVTKHADWTEDEPYYKTSITCVAPDLCNGWVECREPHEVDGVDASVGPYDCDRDAPWLDEDQFDFHGVEHTWQWGPGWTVPFDGCCVAEWGGEAASELAHEVGLGDWSVDDEWDDGYCYLSVVEEKR